MNQNSILDVDAERNYVKKGGAVYLEIRGFLNSLAGTFLNWRLFVKVVDQGTYTLLDSAKKILIEDKNSYVPNKLLPPTDGFGDYLEFEIEAGFIKN